ncbi:MAG: hypothetical protein R6V19_07100 [Armatimonadota bacterium]
MGVFAGIVLCTGQAAGQAFASYDRLSGAIERFVCEIPAADADHQAALKALSALQVAPASEPSDTVAHPTRQRLSTTGARDYRLLHEIGHYLHYWLLPSHFRPLYWHPRQCFDPRASRPDRSAAAPYDEFSEAAADLFVACFTGYCQVHGISLDSECTALLEKADSGVGGPSLVGMYGGEIRRRPVRVYADFLQATIAHSRRNGYIRLPARTTRQWTLSRQMYGGLSGVKLSSPPATPPPQGDHILLLHPGGTFDAKLNDRPLEPRAVRLETNDRVKVGDRPALLVLDAGRTTVAVAPHTHLVMYGGAHVQMKAGQALSDGPVMLSSSSCRATSSANAMAVEVNAAGEMTVGALQGAVTVLPVGGRETSLTAGMVITVPKYGNPIGPGVANPREVAYSLPDLTPATREGELADLPGFTPLPSQARPADDEPPPAHHEVAADEDEWAVFKPRLLPQVALCHGVNGHKEPTGISRVFGADVGVISLFIHFDFGTIERDLDIKWMRDGRMLTGRTMQGKGSRKFVYNLRTKPNRTFVPGQYEVHLDIDGEPAAILGFTVK